MKQERFKASLIEKVCVHAYSVPDVLISLGVNGFIFLLDESYNVEYIDISKNIKDKIPNYEKLVGTFREGNPKHDRIRYEMDRYFCGDLAIRTAKMFGRI